VLFHPLDRRYRHLSYSSGRWTCACCMVCRPVLPRDHQSRCSEESTPLPFSLKDSPAKEYGWSSPSLAAHHQFVHNRCCRLGNVVAFQLPGFLHCLAIGYCHYVVRPRMLPQRAVDSWHKGIWNPPDTIAFWLPGATKRSSD